MPCPKTLGRPAAWALTSSWCMGLKSPDAPAYWTRSVRVSSWVTSGASSPSLTSSKYSFCSATSLLPSTPDLTRVSPYAREHLHHPFAAGRRRPRSPARGEGPHRRPGRAEDRRGSSCSGDGGDGGEGSPGTGG